MGLFGRNKETWKDSRFLPVEGIPNARDIGGYRTSDGKTVKKGLLFRGASLAGATDGDLSYLRSAGVKKVFDFRTDFDKRGKENRILPGAEMIDLPIGTFDPGDAPESITSRKSFDLSKVIMIAAFNTQAQEAADKMYPSLVFNEDCQKQYASFLKGVVSAGEGTLYYHCTQGKDRTGLASTYLLSALGVDRDTIVEDFDLTNRVYEKDLRKFSRRVKLLGGKEPSLRVIRSFIGANLDNFLKVLGSIDDKFGSMEGYLRGPLGLTEEDFRILRERYLEG